MKLSRDIIYKEKKEKYEASTTEQKQKIDWLRNKASIEDYQLKCIKKTKNKLRDGDVFVLTLDGKNYFYGKVLKANLKDTVYNGIYDKLNFIVIFKKHFNRINIEDFKEDYEDILINPCLVPKSYWNLGYFYTIGNNYIKNEDEKIDYGLWSSIDNKLVKINGKQLKHLPKYLELYSLSTEIFVASELQEKIILEPSILDTYNLEIKENKEIKKNITEFDIKISPFQFFVEDKAYISLDIKKHYLKNLFEKYDKEANGYSWEELIKKFRKEYYPEFSRKIRFDSEAEMFLAYCKDKNVLRKFIMSFKEFCESKDVETYISKLKDL